MAPLRKSQLSAFGQALLIGGLLAGALTACGAKGRLQDQAATAAAGRPTAASSGSGAASASATPSTNADAELDSEIQKLETDLNNVDTLNDFNTALSDAQAADSQTAAPAPTTAPASTSQTAGSPIATPAPTTAPSSTDQAALDQMLGTLQDKLNNMDTVPEGANP